MKVPSDSDVMGPAVVAEGDDAALVDSVLTDPHVGGVGWGLLLGARQ